MKSKTSKSKNSRPPKLARILVPTDFSRHAAQALRYAVPLALQVGGKISLLHVLEWPVVPATLGAAMTDEARITGAAKQTLDELARTTVPAELLEKTLVRVGRAYTDIESEQLVRSGTPYDVINQVARREQADLIIIATRGHGAVKQFFIGGTAGRVVRHAPCPVLVVR